MSAMTPAAPARLPRCADVAPHDAALANGQPAPDFTLPRLDAKGGSWTLSDHVGPTSKNRAPALVVVFMASWCGICQKSLPSIAALRSLPDGKPEIVVVSTDDSDVNARKEAARLAEAGLDVALVRGDAATLAAWLGNDRGVPRFFFVNRAGEVLVRDKGFGANVAAMLPRQAGFTINHPDWMAR